MTAGFAHHAVVAAAVAICTAAKQGRADSESAPVAVTLAARHACGGRALTAIAGPWVSARGTHYAAAAWSEGAPRACLVMLRTTSRGAVVVARGEIVAGHSDRYGEYYAPGLRAAPLEIPGFLPAPVTDAILMSHSGGGGSETRVWLVRAGRWSPVFARMLDSVTDINDAVENSCPGSAPLTIVAGRDHSIHLLADECASGQMRVARLRFNGHRFVE